MHHTDLELSSIPQHHVACDDPIMHAQCTPPPPDPQTLTHKLINQNTIVYSGSGKFWWVYNSTHKHTHTTKH